MFKPAWNPPPISPNILVACRRRINAASLTIETLVNLPRIPNGLRPRPSINGRTFRLEQSAPFCRPPGGRYVQ
ncbi:MAG: hypothetical protein BJ554DRAFT_1664 [Olpidium bornovanus]|uniref:Uncharacterized protein n=1 Tax=Olpidium bornovanus TaxID=278681 RepID=A0A8H8DH16_9FUNG|nr:MAG: hypothetical protein BJ554DRAFT_1664 [Olpidium bornovanus]